MAANSFMIITFEGVFRLERLVYKTWTMHVGAERSATILGMSTMLARLQVVEGPHFILIATSLQIEHRAVHMWRGYDFHHC